MTKNIFAEILRSPTLFSMNVVGVKPTRYQAEILEDDNEEIIIIGGRQIGKSTVLALKSLWNAFIRKREEVLILSMTFSQARIVYDKIREWIEGNEFLKAHTEKLTMSEIRFDNGSIIRCLASGYTGETARGYSASMVIFDEAGLIPDEVFTALIPSLAVKGRQRIYSGTPYGKRGYFYARYEEYMKTTKHDNISLYRIPAEDSPFITKEFLEAMKMEMTRLQFEQEFGARFMEETNLFYPHELVRKNIEDYEYELPYKIEDRKIYMGVDIGRLGSDETAIVIVSEDEAGYRKVEWAYTIAKSYTTEVSGRIIDIARKIKIDRIFVDETGVGGGVVDELREALGGLIRGVVFTSKNREKIYNMLKIYLEQKKIKLSANDRKMLYQFGSYTAKYRSDGKLIIVKNKNMHDDLVDALALTFFEKTFGAYDVWIPENGITSPKIRGIEYTSIWR